MRYKTEPDEMPSRYAENTHFLANRESRAHAAIPGETIVGPIIDFHVTYQYLAPTDLKSKFHLRIIQNGHLGF